MFKTEEFVFSYRVAGILIRDGKILLQRPPGDDYSFIGGHVAAMETTRETLVREFKEEIHADIEVSDLLAVGEVFFPWKNRPCHQIGLYYAVHLLAETAVPLEGTFHGYDDLGGERIDLDFCWVPLKQLSEITVYPLGLKEHILSGSKDVLHFVTRESS